MNEREFSDLLEEIEESLKEMAIRSELPKYADLQSYIGTKMEVLGLRSKQINDWYKNFESSLADRSLEQQRMFWDYAWKNSPLFEVLSIALIFIRKRGKKKDADKLLNMLLGWMPRIDNWAHSDEYSHALASLYERLPAPLLDQWQQWNRSNNPWERRQSLVCLIRKRWSEQHQLPFQAIMKLVEPRVDDPDYFVQKAVGWVLRDIALTYPEQTLDWMQSNHTRLSSTAFSTASERTEKELKERWKEARKISRKKGNGR